MQIEMENANVLEDHVGSNANIANFVHLWKSRMEWAYKYKSRDW